MIRQVGEFLAFTAETQLVALCLPLGFRCARNVQQSRPGKLIGKLGLQGDERIYRISVGIESGEDGRVDIVVGGRQEGGGNGREDALLLRVVDGGR